MRPPGRQRLRSGIKRSVHLGARCAANSALRLPAQPLFCMPLFAFHTIPSTRFVGPRGYCRLHLCLRLKHHAGA